jgi:hypothetical protein
MATKRQLLSDVQQLKELFRRSEDAVSARDKAIAEHSNENERLLKVLDNVEAVNRDLHVQKIAMQAKINHLTSVAKSLTAVL